MHLSLLSVPLLDLLVVVEVVEELSPRQELFVVDVILALSCFALIEPFVFFDFEQYLVQCQGVG